MAQYPSSEGRIPFRIPGKDDIPCFTFYKEFGEIYSSSSLPVVILHGGPGAGHEYLLSFADLWPRYGIPVIFYDQIGCASSTHHPQLAGNKSFWQVSLFIAELNNLIDHLELRNGFHLLLSVQLGWYVWPRLRDQSTPGPREAGYSQRARQHRACHSKHRDTKG